MTQRMARLSYSKRAQISPAELDVGLALRTCGIASFYPLCDRGLVVCDSGGRAAKLEMNAAANCEITRAAFWRRLQSKLNLVERTEEQFAPRQCGFCKQPLVRHGFVAHFAGLIVMQSWAKIPGVLIKLRADHRTARIA